MSSISLDLSSHQLKKLGNGNKIIIKPEMVGKGIKLKLPTEHIKAINNAKKSGKAYKIQLTTTEGGDLKKTLKTIWRGYQKYVKPVVAPAIRKGLTQAVKVGLPALAVATGNPELAPGAAWVANEIGDKVVNQIGDVTGAYGLHSKKHKLKDDYSLIISPDHPAFTPYQKPLKSGGRMNVNLHLGKPKLISRSGSFIPAGY